jgi:hypothetical protein
MKAFGYSVPFGKDSMCSGVLAVSVFIGRRQTGTELL